MMKAGKGLVEWTCQVDKIHIQNSFAPNQQEVN